MHPAPRALLASVAIVLSGCPAEVTGPNRPPMAAAGEDLVETIGETVDLDGSGSHDPDGDVLGFQWELVAVPTGGAATLVDADKEQASFVPDVRGVWAVRLTVSDGTLASGPDVVLVRVTGGAPCSVDADCDTDELWCNGENVCAGGRCEFRERLCDDADPCTQDVCDEELNRCQHPPVAEPPGPEGPPDDATCADGVDNDCDGWTDADDTGCLVCEGDDECDDQNTCTRDSCDGERCHNDPADNGFACLDGLFCTINDVCNGGRCVGSPRDCTGEEDACNASTCDDDADACTTLPLPDGTACDDDNLCTIDDACDGAGECYGTDVTIVPIADGGCDDGNFCTHDGCDPVLGQCLTLSHTDPCDDGAPCTSDDRCDGAGHCAGTPDDSACPAGQVCRPLCFAAADGCGTPPASLQLTCAPGDVDLFSEDTTTCTLTSDGPGQLTCLDCRAEVGLVTVDASGFDDCGLQGWIPVTGPACSDSVANCAPGGSLSRPCCDDFSSICVTVGSQSYLRTDEVQNCGGGFEQWRLEKQFDLRGLWNNEVCADIADVNANASQGVLVRAHDRTHADEHALCLNGEPRAGTDGVFYRYCDVLPAWTQDNPAVVLRLIGHSENDDRAMLVDNVTVRGWRAGCAEQREIALQEDFAACPDPFQGIMGPWTITGDLECTTGFDCLDAGDRFETSGGTGSIEARVDASRLDGDVELCFHYGDDGDDTGEHFLVEFDAGAGWEIAFEHLGDPGANQTCRETCVNLSDRKPAVNRNPALGIRFSLTSQSDKLVVDHVVLSGARWCDASDEVEVSALTDNGDGSYGFEARNLDRVTLAAEVACRFDPAPVVGTWVDFLDPHPAWSRRRRIVFDNANQDEDLIDFPVLVKLENNWFDFDRTQDAGEDLRFLDADLTTRLDHEIERWNEGDTSVVWVRVPHIPGNSTNDHIWMYYDNPQAVDTQRPGRVWDRTFQAVWHLAETTGATAYDSTTRARNGSYRNTPALGQDGGYGDLAVDLDGGNEYVSMGTFDVIGADGNNGITLEVFALPEAVDAQERLLSKSDGNGINNHWWMLSLDNAGTRLRFRLKLDGTTQEMTASSGQVSNGTWLYAVAAYDGGHMRLYLDGQEIDSRSASGAISTGAGKEVRIGANLPGVYEPWDGRIGEVRISDVGRSAGWVQAQFRSVSGAFVTFGQEEAR